MSALAKHLQPKLTEARLARQYAAIAARVEPRGSRKGAWAAGFALTAAAAVAVAWRLHAPQAAATIADGTVLESAPEGSGPSVTLADGSKLALAADTRVKVAHAQAKDVVIELQRGRVDVAATHAEGRRFSVMAHGCEVSVVGTRFDVVVLPDDRARVDVSEGRVRVSAPDGEVRFVGAGESWTERAATPAPSAAPATSADPSAPTDEIDDGDATPPKSGPTTARRPPPADAKALLEAAQRANAEGRARDAAELFDALRRKYRGNARAGLAAFELGKIRLDSLGDPAGAEEAFAEAARVARSASLREDAEARRVEALAAMGSSRCVEARDAYLARYPQGIHRAEVAARCGKR